MQDVDNEVIKKAAEKMSAEVAPWANSKVGGGVMVYVNQFFPEDGVMQLKRENEQLKTLLQLFLSIEKLFKVIQDCLNLMSDSLRDDEVSYIKQNEYTLYQTEIDEMKREFEEIRESREIDAFMAEQRDDMDSDDDEEDW